MSTKTPLQAAVCVICDCLCQLPPEDQPRALEAVRVTLGLSPFKDPAPPQGYRAPSPYEPPEADPPLQTWEPEPPARRRQGPLPTVVVQMVNGRPVIANQQVGRTGPGLGLVRVGLDSAQAPRLRQLASSRLPADDTAPADALALPPGDASVPPRRGYVRDRFARR
jgi:hypothetical protein